MSKDVFLEVTAPWPSQPLTAEDFRRRLKESGVERGRVKVLVPIGRHV